MRRATHIRMPSQLVKHSIVKVSRVAHKGAGNVIRVLHALHDIAHDISLAELELPGLGLHVQLVDPAVVSSSLAMLDVLLELHNVAVGDVFGVDRLDERCFGDDAAAEEW